MPTTVSIWYLKDQQRIPTPDKFPVRVTVDADEWSLVTTEMVEEAIALRLERHGLRPSEPVDFAYVRL